METETRKPETSTREGLLRRLDEGMMRAGSYYNASVIQGSIQVEEAYRSLAILSFLEDGDLDGFFHGMSLSAATRLRFLTCVARGMVCPPDLLRVTYATAIFTALASADRRLLTELARSELLIKVDAGEPKPEVAFARALRKVITGHFTEAREPFMRFARSRGPSDQDRALILAGILKSDGARFNEGLRRFIDALPRRRRGEARLSIEAVGFARLGQNAGLSVTATDPAIPVELLGEAEAPYPDATKVLPPIEEEIIDVPVRARA